MEQLYSLDVLIDKIVFVSDQIQVCDKGDLRVSVSFGSLVSFVVETQDLQTPYRSWIVLPSRDISIRTGKTFLFPIKPSELTKMMNQFPLEIALLKMDEEEPFGRVALPWTFDFKDMVYRSSFRPQFIDPVGVKGDFDIISLLPEEEVQEVDGGDEVKPPPIIAKIRMFYKLTARGGNIETQLQIQQGQEIKGKKGAVSYLMKAAKGDTVQTRTYGQEGNMDDLFPIASIYDPANPKWHPMEPFTPENMTADKLNCMLCKNPDCPGAQRFKNFGIGPAATGGGLGTLYKEAKTPVAYALSQTYGTLDYYGPYGVFTPPPEPCAPDCACLSNQHPQTLEEVEKEIPLQEGAGEDAGGAGEGDGTGPLRLTGGAGDEGVLESASMMCKELVVCFERVLAEYMEALKTFIELDEKTQEHEAEVNYVNGDSEPLRLTGGAGEEESGVPAPVMMCKDLLDSFDRVLVEYKKALGPCGKAECSFSQNIALESCKKVCKMDVTNIEEVELPSPNGNVSACGVTDCPFSRKPQTDTDLYFQKKQYKAGCGSVTCPFSKIKFGTANEDDLLELNMMNATSCGSPKCPSSIPQRTPAPLEPIHWDCPDPLPKGPCRNPMCPLKPPELRYKPKGPCGSSDCPWAPPPSCGGADCPFPVPSCPPPQCPPPPCPPSPRPACPPPPCQRPPPPQFCSGCGNPACPSTPRTCGDPYCPLNPAPLPCPAMTGGVCPPPPCPPPPCAPPPCPFQPCPFPGPGGGVAKQNSVCSNPACPFASPRSSPCGSPTCPFGDSSAPAAASTLDDICSNPACPFAKKESACFDPQCPFAKPQSLVTATALCANPSCPFAKPPVPSSGGDCGNPSCPYASKPQGPASGGDVCGNPSCPYAKPQGAAEGICANPSCPYASAKSQEASEGICANPACPYASAKPQEASEGICANPSCPYAKSQGGAAKICPNPQCPYAQQAQSADDICRDPNCPLNQVGGGGPVGQQDSFCNNPSCPFKGQGGLEPCSPQTCMAFGGPLECDMCAQQRRKSSGGKSKGKGSFSGAAGNKGNTMSGDGGSGGGGSGTGGGKRPSKSAPAISKKPKAKKSKDGSQSESVIRPKTATKDASASAKRKALLSYKIGDLYPGTNVGHRECIIPGRNVPAKMGWLWNVHVPCVGLKPRLGWRPGALSKSIAKRIMMHRKAQGLKMLPPFRDAKGKGKSKKGKSRSGYGDYESDSDETVAPKPTLQVKKREGAYYITVNPLKDPKTLEDNENPYMDCTPMQFKIVKNKKEDDNRTCFCGEEDEESSDSELDIEFTPPAGIIRPDRLRRKKNVAHTDTQYNPDDFSPPKAAGGKGGKGGGGGKGKKK